MIINVKEGQDLTGVLSQSGSSEEPLFVVLPHKAVFRQKVHCAGSNMVVMGNSSTIVWNDHNGQTPGFGTADSATLTVSGSNVLFTDLEVINDFDYAAGRKSIPGDMRTVIGLQAVAVYTAKEADLVSFDNCTFTSHQDTLFTDCVRSLFVNCTIEGCVDFIFGASYADFHNCTVISNGTGFVAAPSTPEDSEYGISFFDCNFTCTPEVADGSVFLARPWHPGGKPGVNSFVFFSGCTLGRHISPNLWASMMDTLRKLHKPEENRFIIDEATLATLK